MHQQLASQALSRERAYSKMKLYAALQLNAETTDNRLHASM